MQHGKHNTMQYNLALPKGFDPTQKYPLIIHLHGAGSRGHDPAGITYSYKLEAYIQDHDLPLMLVAPLCEVDSWYMCFSELVEFVRFAASMENVDPDRVYLLGNSMGGYATWGMLMCVPELIAAAVPICGGGMAWNVGRMKDVPVWAFHGVDDGVVSVNESITMASALRNCGGVVLLTLLPGVDHNAWDPALYDYGALEWMLEHKRGVYISQKNI